MSERGILYFHVVPMGDLRDHIEREACWCRPTKKGLIIVHNAMDERETYEQGRRKQ